MSQRVTPHVGNLSAIGLLWTSESETDFIVYESPPKFRYNSAIDLDELGNLWAFDSPVVFSVTFMGSMITVIGTLWSRIKTFFGF